MKKQISLMLTGILVTSLILAGCGSTSANERIAAESATESVPFVNVNDDIVSASAEVTAGKWANLAFMLGGQKADVFVKVGDRVKSGDVLASFPEDMLPQTIINAQADLILAQKSLDDLLKADTALAQAMIALRNAKESYDKAFDYRDSLKYKITIEEVTTEIKRTPFGKIEIPKIKRYKAYADKTTIAKADEDLALKKAILDDAQRELDRLNNLQSSPEVVAAKTRLDAIQSIIDQSKLIAPFDGTVVELYTRTGEMASPGAPVLLLADLSTLRVKTTDLNEVDVARVHIGDPVKVTFDALPNTSVPGKVTEISLKNSSVSGVYFDVVVELDEIPDVLRWGMSAFVEIQVSG